MTTITGVTPGQKEQTATDRRHAATGSPSGQSADQTSNLVVRYGAIGIPAVAAALRYTAAAKNPAYAPVMHRVDPHLTDMAA